MGESIYQTNSRISAERLECISNILHHIRLNKTIAERKNRTIQEMARSMMKAKNIGDEFWGEGVYTTVYLLNRSPTKPLVNKTLEEAWTGIKPDVSNLKIFGCIAYAHVPDEKMTKMESKSIKCIFIGYS
eukprot:Gb_37775 [translate_table: standard]